MSTALGYRLGVRPIRRSVRRWDCPRWYRAPGLPAELMRADRGSPEPERLPAARWRGGTAWIQRWADGRSEASF